MIEFEKSYRIPVYDTGFNGDTWLHSLLNYVQDIASEHAEVLQFGRDDLRRANQFWILSRIYSEIYRMPHWGETITLNTWPRGTEGLFALRDIEIKSDNGETIAAVTTSWVIVDIDTRRPQRPDSLLKKMNLDYPQNRALKRNAEKLPAVPAGGVITPSFIVKPSDLDVNYHVNNVKYIQWAYDSMSMEFLSSYIPGSVEVNYLAESVAGDQLSIKSGNYAEENNIYIYSVIRSSNNREISRIMIDWKPIPNQKVL